MSIEGTLRAHPRVALVATILLLLAAATVAIFAGCAVDNDGGIRPNGNLAADCKGCHTDKEMLIATAAPDTSTGSESSGEG